MTIAHLFGLFSLLAHLFLSVVLGTITGYALMRIQPPGSRDRMHRYVTEREFFRASAFGGIAVTIVLAFLSFQHVW